MASVIGEKSPRETEGFLGLCCKALYLLSRLLFKQARTVGVPQFPSGINVLDVVDVAFVLSVSSPQGVFVLFCVCARNGKRLQCGLFLLAVSCSVERSLARGDSEQHSGIERNGVSSWEIC